MELKIGIASDHGGYQLKSMLNDYFEKIGYSYIDYGTYTPSPVDYPDISYLLCEGVLKKEVDFGIVICGTGIGVSISCNKIKGIRCALVYGVEIAGLAKKHNNANVIALGGRFISLEQAIEYINAYINETYETRHQTRLDKIKKLEEIN
jgi:ribose 5-phosphate isomerase B